MALPVAPTVTAVAVEPASGEMWFIAGLLPYCCPTISIAVIVVQFRTRESLKSPLYYPAIHNALLFNVKNLPFITPTVRIFIDLLILRSVFNR